MTQPTIGMVQALNVVTQAHPGVNVVGASLDNENGYLVYSVRLETGLDVKVDAGNRTVLSSDQWQKEEGQIGENRDVAPVDNQRDGEYPDKKPR